MTTQIERGCSTSRDKRFSARTSTNTLDQDELSIVDVLRRAGVHLDAEDIEIVWRRQGRHRTALVRDSNNHVWLVKRQGGYAGARRASLTNEIAFHVGFVAIDRSSTIARRVPRHVGHIADEALVLEGYSDGVTLDRALLCSYSDEGLIRQIGDFVGFLHSISPDEHTACTDPSRSAYKTITSPVITHGRVSPTQFANRPAGYASLLPLLQRAPGLNRQLRSLRESWRVTSFIHGDLKIDNVLTLHGDARRNEFRIIDWELFGIGDPYWDCASVIGSMYYLWIANCLADDQTLAASISEHDINRYVGVFLDAYGNRARQQLDYGKALAWAGYWIAHKVLGTLGPERQLPAQQLAAMHLAQQLLSELDHPRLRGTSSSN